MCQHYFGKVSKQTKFHTFTELTFYLQKQKKILKIETMGLVDGHDVRCEKQEFKKSSKISGLK